MILGDCFYFVREVIKDFWAQKVYIFLKNTEPKRIGFHEILISSIVIMRVIVAFFSVQFKPVHALILEKHVNVTISNCEI